MVQEIRGGFRNLARYAEEFQKDSEKAARIRARQKEVDDFLDKEGLSQVRNVATQLENRRREGAYAREIQYLNHLAVVAQEALRIEDGEFVHSGPNSVMRALKAKIAEGSTPGLISGFKDKALAHQVSIAGRKVASWPVFRGGNSSVTLTDVVSSPIFERQVPYEGWRQTIEYASQALPAETRIIDLSILLMGFATLGKYKSVQVRMDSIPGRPTV